MQTETRETWFRQLCNAVHYAWTGPAAAPTEEERAALRKRKAELEGRLESIQMPDSAPDEVRTAIKEYEASLYAGIKEADDDDELDDIEEAIDELPDEIERAINAALLQELSTYEEEEEPTGTAPRVSPDDLSEYGVAEGTLAERVDAIRAEVDKIYNPAALPVELTHASDAEKDELANQRQSIRDLLESGGLTIDLVKKAAIQKVALAAERAGVEGAIKFRHREADELRNDPQMTAVVAEAKESELVALVAARKKVTDALAAVPLTDEVLERATALVSEVRTVRKAAGAAVRLRLENEAAAILADARMNPDPAVDGLEDVARAKRLIREVLHPAELRNEVIETGRAMLRSVLEPALKKARETDRTLRMQVDDLLNDFYMTAKLADAAEDDLKPIADARLEVTKALNKPTPTAADVQLVEATHLPAVETAYNLAAKAITQRKKDAEKLLKEIDADGEFSKSPEGSLPKQIAELNKARKKMRDTLTTAPLTDESIEQGTKDRDELKKLYEKVNKSIEAMGGAASIKQLATAAGSRENVEALYESFAPENATKFKTLLADLGGKEPVKKILAAFPESADLKQVHDTFGGAKCMGELLETGCGGNAATLKALADTLPDEADQKQLADLIKNGGFAAKPEILGNVVKTALTANPTKGKALLKNLATTFAEEKDQKALAQMLGEGGLDSNPTLLATLLQQGCDGDPANLKKITDAFPAEGTTAATDRAKFKAIVTTGGLADNPLVFSHLLKTGCGGDGAKLKQFALTLGDDANKARKLKSLLTTGGMGGGTGESKATLGQVLRDGFTDPNDGAFRPEKLLALHDTFAAPPPGLAQMKNIFDGFNSGSAPKKEAGKKFANVLGHMTARVPGTPPPVPDNYEITALKATFYNRLDAKARSGNPSQVVRQRRLTKLICNAGTFEVATMPDPLPTPDGLPPATAAEASQTAQDEGEAAQLAADEAAKGPKGNPRLTTAATETGKAATEAKTAAAKTLAVQVQANTVREKTELLTDAQGRLQRATRERGPLLDRKQELLQEKSNLWNQINPLTADIDNLKLDKQDHLKTPNRFRNQDWYDRFDEIDLELNTNLNARTKLFTKLNKTKDDLDDVFNDIQAKENEIANNRIAVDDAYLDNIADLNNAANAAYLEEQDLRTAWSNADTAAGKAEQAAKQLEQARDLSRKAADLAPEDTKLAEKANEDEQAAGSARSAADAARKAANGARAAAKAVALRDIGEVDMAHICGRHKRDLFSFQDPILAAPNAPIEKQKPTTLFPDGYTDADVAACVDEALDQLFQRGTVPKLDQFVAQLHPPNPNASPFLNGDVFLPTQRVLVRIGLELRGDKLEITQFYVLPDGPPPAPPEFETLEFHEMHALKNALGQ